MANPLVSLLVIPQDNRVVNHLVFLASSRQGNPLQDRQCNLHVIQRLNHSVDLRDYQLVSRQLNLVDNPRYSPPVNPLRNPQSILQDNRLLNHLVYRLGNHQVDLPCSPLGSLR